MPEEDSSSQNVNLRIDAVDSYRASGDGFKIKLSDGSFFYVSYAFYREARLGCGIDVDEELLVRLENESQRQLCRQKAFDFLSLREHSVFELSQKLKHKRFSTEIVRSVLSELTEKRVVDDERFAQLYIESHVRRGKESRTEMAAKLAGKGVASETVRSLINRFYDVETEEKIAAALVQKAAASGKPADRVKESLLRKGFPFRVVKALFPASADDKEE